jgi:hypothetical protein
MDTDTFLNIEHLITALLQKHAKDYLTVKQIVAGLPSVARRRLALTPKHTTTSLVQKLTPYLGNNVQVYKGGRSTYIGRNMPIEEMIVHRIRQKPGVSSKQLGMQLPVTNKPYLTALNGLLQSGAVVCTLKDNHTACLNLADSAFSRPVAQQGEPGDDQTALRAAYDQVGQGRRFVRIHRLRESLQWTRERFDRGLQDLRAAYKVEIHGGDPSQLTETEIRNSYLDENGMLYITLSWSGAP